MNDPITKYRCGLKASDGIVLRKDPMIKNHEDNPTGKIQSEGVRLFTNRLELMAITLDHVCTGLEAPECLAALLNALAEAEIPPGEFDRDAQVPFRDNLKEDGASAVGGWYGWYTVQRTSPHMPSVLIGEGGYFGPPGGNGEVEIGFSIMSAWQSLGYATELVGMLIDNAFIDNRVQKIIAHASPGNLASCKVLEKCGLNYVCREEGSGNSLYAIIRDISA
jgi:[ribosomal protein S5]-alanine N-acetyltransferase